jgi:hypothetical protein
MTNATPSQALSSLLRIIVVNEERSDTKEGRAWAMQDAECILMNDDGSPKQVGVLQLPKEIRAKGAVKPGDYTGSFALRPDLRTRRIEAVLVDLTPLPPGYFRAKGQPAPSGT